ncbi:MAG: hypothetical protein AAF752_16565 [Bacteroidota bacterium]
MTTLSLILAALAYVAFYVASPGRQSKALKPAKPIRIAGIVLVCAAFVLSVLGTGSAVGPVLVITVLMAVGSLLVVTGPFFMTAPERRSRRRPR